MSNITYQVETFSEWIEDAASMIEEHWDEVALFKDTTPLSPNWEVYSQLEDMDLFHVVTARDGEKLVGYTTYILSTNLHYVSVRQAETDVYYVHPSYRKGMTGVKLFKEAEKSLKAKGVNKIVTKAKLHNRVGELLAAMDYIPIEVVLVKQLGE